MGTSEMALGYVLGRSRRGLDVNMVVAVQPPVLCINPGPPRKSFPQFGINFLGHEEPQPARLLVLCCFVCSSPGPLCQAGLTCQRGQHG